MKASSVSQRQYPPRRSQGNNNVYEFSYCSNTMVTPDRIRPSARNRLQSPLKKPLGSSSAVSETVSPTSSMGSSNSESSSSFQSPSFATLALSSPRTNCSSIILRSSISVDEDGAEVILCELEAPSRAPVMITPRKLNLLDVEMTPSPLKSMRSLDDVSHATPKTVGFCGLGDCDIPMNPCSSNVRDVTSINDTAYMHYRISALLAIPNYDDSWLGGYWQAWGLSCDDDVYSSSSSQHAFDTREAKQNIQRVLKNRAFDLNAKHRRLSSLRRDLSPFSIPLAASETVSDSNMFKARSFTQQARTPPPRKKSATPESKLPFLQRALQCGIAQESPLFIKSNNEELYYDSDPEDFIRRQRISKTRPMTAATTIPGKENTGPRSARAKPRVVSLQEDEQVISLVQEVMNEQMKLILHQNTASARHRSHAVQCWIERGQQLRNSIIAPKLCWKSIIIPPPGTHSRPSQPTTKYEFSSVNLMDISRVLNISNGMIDAKEFPFCKSKHAFMIKTMDRTLIFETHSPAERDRIVKSLRLVVARLGSLLLTKNERLADEYFAFVDNGQYGPGEEPYWLGTV